MIQWKERLYAFLLNKVLGPYLAPESLQELHRCLDVSLSDGSVALRRVHLNLDKLNGLVGRASSSHSESEGEANRGRHEPRIRFRRARVSRLEIVLALVEHDGSSGLDGPNSTGALPPPTTTATTPTSFAWRAVQFSSTSGSSVSLVASVLVDGLEIDVAPYRAGPPDSEDGGPSASSPVGTSNPSVGGSAAADATTTASSSSSSVRGLISSYLEAALASLRLSIEIRNASVRILSEDNENIVASSISASNSKGPYRKPSSPSWLEVRLLSASYGDNRADNGADDDAVERQGAQGLRSSPSLHPDAVPRPPSAAPVREGQPPYETVVNKAVEFTRVTVRVGSGGRSDEFEGAASRDEVAAAQAASTVALLDGKPGRVVVRVVEYRDSAVDDRDHAGDSSPVAPFASTPEATETRGAKLPSPSRSRRKRRIQHDVQVVLNQRLNVGVDAASLLQIKSIANGFASASVSGPSGVDAFGDSNLDKRSDGHRRAASSANAAAPAATDADDDADRADWRSIDGIMNEYHKARLRAQQNHFRGGILMPSTDDYDNDPSSAADPDIVTFDAFFDANEHSVGRFSTILSESVLMMSPDAEEEGSIFASFVHTKLHFHLEDGSIKVSFDPKADSVQPRRGADEYLLLSFSEVTATASLSHASSEHSLSISRIDVEDSQIIEVPDSTVDSGAKSRRVDIGTVIKFNPTFPESTAYRAQKLGTIVSDPVCLLVSSKTQLADSNGRSTEIDIVLEPFEVTYRDRTMSNVSLFAGSLSSFRCESNHPETDCETEKTPRSFHIFCSCPEVTVSVPVNFDTEWIGLYRRRGYLQDVWIARSSLCLSLSGVTFEVSSSIEAPAVAFAFHYAILYVQSPNRNLEGTALRFDVLCVSGRTEVDPILSVSFELWKIRASAGEKQGLAVNEDKAIQSFPKVPAISSFKAREEDEDDEKRVDQARSSYANEFKFDPKRSNLRFVDPQTSMISAVASSSSVLDIRISEIIAEVSFGELYILSCIAANLTLKRDSKALPRNMQTVDCMSVVLACDACLLELAEDVLDGNTQSSFLIQLEMICTHVLSRRQGPLIRQMRFVTHDFGLLQVMRSNSPCSNVPFNTVRDKLRERMKEVSSSSPSLVIHRTSLFRAISSRSPVLLLDFVDHSDENGPNDSHLHTNAYLTLYDLTCRLNYDDRSIERLLSLLASDGGKTVASTDVVKPTRFRVTRLFFTMVDCNCDYLSSVHFSTPSRAILRVGDLRVSSNLVSPRPSVQAVSASLGDLALYVAKTRYPYSFEDSKFTYWYLSMGSSSHGELNGSPDSIQKDMGLITIAVLDSLDAVATLSRAPSGMNPKLLINATIGELGVFACKDSFARVVTTLSELAAEMTALDSSALEELRTNTYSNLEVVEHEENKESDESPGAGTFHTLEHLKRQSALRPTAGTSCSFDEANEFLLDGYDWTTIDQGRQGSAGAASGEEQSARWYTNSSKPDDSSEENDAEIAFLPTFVSPEAISSMHPVQKGPRIISHHFPSYVLSDPLMDADQGIVALAGTALPPSVGTRVIIHDFRVKIRFFDGFDWPELLPKARRHVFAKGDYIIEEQPFLSSDDQNTGCAGPEFREPSRKGKLMEDLLGSELKTSSTFREVPLAEERSEQLLEKAWLQRFGRRPSKYFQISGSGMRIRFDALGESKEHRLATVFSAKVQDIFLAETLSSDRPVKFAGEWVNELEHPRDSKDGLFAVKMATWHPVTRVTPNNEIVNDEAEIVFRMLPLRCMIDQRAVRFARCYFLQLDVDGESTNDATEIRVRRNQRRYSFPPPLFRSFRFLQVKLKIDYRPEKLDANAIYNGALVELINLSPIDGLVLTLQQVRGENEIGFGNVLMKVASHWLEDVCSTQLHKFVTSARAVDPFANIGSAALDMVILPWEAIQNGESVRRALRAGTAAFAGTVVTEALNVGSRVTKFMADQVARRTTGMLGVNVLPSRPLDAPRGLREATPHVVETLTRGFQAANYTVVIVPYREYRRRGATGAITSVIKGIPVAIAAPASGAAEAISYAAIGVRNQVRPDLRKEEEASLRGLYSDA